MFIASVGLGRKLLDAANSILQIKYQYSNLYIHSAYETKAFETTSYHHVVNVHTPFEPTFHEYVDKIKIL